MQFSLEESPGRSCFWRGWLRAFLQECALLGTSWDKQGNPVCPEPCNNEPRSTGREITGCALDNIPTHRFLPLTATRSCSDRHLLLLPPLPPLRQGYKLLGHSPLAQLLVLISQGLLLVQLVRSPAKKEDRTALQPFIQYLYVMLAASEWGRKAGSPHLVLQAKLFQGTSELLSEMLPESKSGINIHSFHIFQSQATEVSRDSNSRTGASCKHKVRRNLGVKAHQQSSAGKLTTFSLCLTHIRPITQ